MIEIKFSFATPAEGAAFLSALAPTPAVVAVESAPAAPTAAKAKPPKSAPAEAPAPTPSIADVAPPTPPADAPSIPKIEYAPLGVMITTLVADGKAAEIKEAFKLLLNKSGEIGVKKGSEVHEDALGDLKAALEAIAARSADALG